MNTINYKGKSFNTNLYKTLTDDEYKQIKETFYAKPNYENVVKEFIIISKGGFKNTNITNYYYRDLMAKVKLYSNKYSVEDIFDHKPLVEWLMGKIEKNIRVYGEDSTLLRKLDTALRIGTSGVATKITNFPIKSVDIILQKYNVNNNYYDFSCGWGTRLISSLKNNVNYYGTDPNYLLIERLFQMTNDYKKEISTCKSNVEIKTQGSEIFIPDWENKMGLAFSSPPYYNLEDYKIGNQSYKEGTTYEQWLDYYFKPTIQNIYRYLIKEGILAINVKSFDKYNLLEDAKKIIIDSGFIFVKDEPLVASWFLDRPKKTKDFVKHNEVIMIFKKDINDKPIKEKEQETQTNIFDFLEGKL